MDAPPTDPQPPRWVPWSGLVAVVGAVLWTAMPWLRRAMFGTRPYVVTGADVVAAGGWLLMVAGLVGVSYVFDGRYGRLGRVGVATTATGFGLVAVVRLRSILVFVDAGFRAVPATGEDPAGLVVTLGILTGFGLVHLGAGVLGIALYRLDHRLTPTAALLVATPALLALAIALRFLPVLPLPVGVVLVRTPLAFLPLGVAWAALGRLVWTVSRRDSSRS